MRKAPKNTSGLIPFKKGKSGNPNGRPPKLPGIDELMVKVLGEAKGDKSAAEALLRALYRKALKGDVRAAEVLLERGYGKTLQKFQGEIDNNVKFVFTKPT